MIQSIFSSFEKYGMKVSDFSNVSQNGRYGKSYESNIRRTCAS